MGMIRSLHGKLILACGLAVAVTLVISGYLFTTQQDESWQRFQVDAHSYHSALIMEALCLSMPAGGMDSTKALLEREILDPEIAAIRVIGSQGQVAISAGGVPYASDDSVTAVDSIITGDSLFVGTRGEVMSVVVPIYNGKECSGCHAGSQPILGYLEVDYLRGVASQGIEGTQSLVVGLAVFLVVLLALSLYLLQFQFVKKPLGKLDRAIKEAMDGNLSVSVNVSGTDEISRLTDHFNQLVKRLLLAQEELKAMHNREMERAERLATAGELASGIAHEIKNPLAGIASTLQVKLDGEPKDSADAEILTEMSVQVRRIEKAVKDLLAYACPTQPAFKSQSININISRCVSFIRPVAERQGTAIDTVLADDIPEFLLDATLMDQVFINIVMNAFQALREGGRVLLTSRFDSRSQRAIITIEDDGPGLGDKIAPRVFRPFFTTKHKGSGLGLSICKKNVEHHCGTIEVESEAGEGARFIIGLPVNVSFEQLLKSGASA